MSFDNTFNRLLAEDSRVRKSTDREYDEGDLDLSGGGRDEDLDLSVEDPPFQKGEIEKSFRNELNQIAQDLKDVEERLNDPLNYGGQNFNTLLKKLGQDPRYADELQGIQRARPALVKAAQEIGKVKNLIFDFLN